MARMESGVEKMAKEILTAEEDRLAEANRGDAPWKSDTFKIECPTGSGQWMNLFDVSREIADRLTRIFLPDAQGNRPVHGGARKFQTDPHWRDHILFYEYFHGDNGAGLGASHQTGWTGLVARMIQYYGSIDAAATLAGPERPATRVYRRT